MLRFLVASVVLVLGAVVSTFFVLLATNGFDTGRADSAGVALVYLLIALSIVLLLAFASVAASGRLSERFRWRGVIALPLVLIPALLLELFALLGAGISLAVLSTPIG